MVDRRWQRLVAVANVRGHRTAIRPHRGEYKQQLREELLLEALEVDELIQQRTLYHARAAAGLSSMSAEYTKQCLKQTQNEVEKLGQLRFPWLDWAPQDDKLTANDVVSMTDEWKRIYGDPNDPKVAAKIADTIKYMKSLAKNANK